jgi:hypothetical protein
VIAAWWVPAGLAVLVLLVILALVVMAGLGLGTSQPDEPARPGVDGQWTGFESVPPEGAPR